MMARRRSSKYRAAAGYRTALWHRTSHRRASTRMRNRAGGPAQLALRRIETEPVEAVRRQCQKVWQLADRGKACLAEDFERRPASVVPQIELDRLDKAREVV